MLRLQEAEAAKRVRLSVRVFCRAAWSWPGSLATFAEGLSKPLFTSAASLSRMSFCVRLPSSCG